MYSSAPHSIQLKIFKKINQHKTINGAKYIYAQMFDKKWRDKIPQGVHSKCQWTLHWCIYA